MLSSNKFLKNLVIIKIRTIWHKKRFKNEKNYYIFDTIRGIGYIEASELCPQFVKNLIAFLLLNL